MMKTTVKSMQLIVSSWDYDPNSFEFAIRIPTIVHGLLLASIQFNISEQLETIRAGEDHAAILAKKIVCLDSSDVLLQDGTVRCPDLEFQHIDSQFPGLIVEIVNSQTKKDGGKNLTKLADQYVLESSGGIKTVIGILNDYQGTKRATLSIWHPKYLQDNDGEYLASEQTVVFEVYILT